MNTLILPERHIAITLASHRRILKAITPLLTMPAIVTPLPPSNNNNNNNNGHETQQEYNEY